MKKKYTAYANSKKRTVKASKGCEKKPARKAISASRKKIIASSGWKYRGWYPANMFKYCGISDIDCLVIGDSDPILIYQGKFYNSVDVEEGLLYEYQEEHPEDPNYDNFQDWLHNDPELVYNQMYDLNPYSKSELREFGLVFKDDAVEESTRTSKRRITAAKVYADGLGSYEPWSGAKDTWRNLEKFNCIDALEQYLDEVYYNESMGEGVINETELNDLLWFEPEVVYEAVGLYYNRDTDEVSDEPFDDEDEDEGE